MQPPTNTTLQRIADELNRNAGVRDRSPDWPDQEWQRIADAGLLRSILPPEFSGIGSNYARILDGYRAVAGGSVAVALILTQRDSAVDLIARGSSRHLHTLLPAHAAGQRCTSVGISQVTTSKGASRPKLRAAESADGFRLDGLMPWVSGAHACHEIVTAAVLDDGRQILAAVPADAAGVRIDPPMELLALEASGTCVVHCEAVEVSNDWIIKPPSEAALTGRAPVKGLTVTAVGLGLSDRIVLALEDLRARTPDEIWDPVAPLIARQAELAAEFTRAVETVAKGTPVESTPLRVRLNDLLTRLAVALVNVGKGSGYVRGQLPERLLREAMFFQVWSSPDPVRAATLQRISEDVQV